jgi:hypothetical protein
MRKRSQNPYRSSVLIGLAALLVCGAALLGCGKKGPPALPDVKAPQGVRDLSVSRAGEEILLSWRKAHKEDAQGVAGYMVYRSAEPADADACEGCPVLFKRVARIIAADAKDGAVKMTYREPYLPGTRYLFKVVPYDGQGQLGADSNIVRLTTD